jgi:hypothetical protein
MPAPSAHLIKSSGAMLMSFISELITASSFYQRQGTSSQVKTASWLLAAGA